jgi:hypothetical protein
MVGQAKRRIRKKAAPAKKEPLQTQKQRGKTQQQQQQQQQQIINFYATQPKTRRAPAKRKPPQPPSQPPPFQPPFQPFYISRPDVPIIAREPVKEATQPQRSVLSKSQTQTTEYLAPSRSLSISNVLQTEIPFEEMKQAPQNNTQTVSGNVDSILSQSKIETPKKIPRLISFDEDIGIEPEPNLARKQSDIKRNELRVRYRNTFGVSKAQSEQAGYTVKYLKDTLDAWDKVKNTTTMSASQWIRSHLP